ncbi:UNKNOWN [Stylonychia lemnae]|uniref:VPS9 domain-containing protein n=1 Tax=Stylonychia lemnae TaxID=5949 RepID=A0A078AKA9_STYLE|nr:UNKNOWN [Stylonychia lemnae]|eukprot:CDW82331.1 UNKNOWN [Stylonychia lemnae]
MRGMNSELNSVLSRKMTQMQKKLQQLDDYPTAQNFISESQIDIANVINQKSKEEIKIEEGGTFLLTNKKSIKNLDSDILCQTLKKTEESTLLSTIFKDVNKIKNIEDFNAPVSNIDKILQTLLYQMRANLFEPDHPINMIIKKFSDIILWNVNERKNQLLRFTKQNQQPQYEMIDKEDGLSEMKSKEAPSDFERWKLNNLKYSTVRPKKNNRFTYDRQTLNQLPPEVQYAEVVIAEVKKLICILYGTLIRFYIPVMKFDDLHEMREDLIELLTSLTVRGDMSKLLLQLCRISTTEDEFILMSKYNELKKTKPEDIGIGKLFRLNKRSYLIELFAQQQMLNVDHGDVGGSDVSFDALIREQRLGSSQNQENQLQRYNTLIQQEGEIGNVRCKSWVIQKNNQKNLTQEDNRPNITRMGVNDEFMITTNLIKERIKNKPFMDAILNVRSLRDYETPIDKMRCITQTSKYIVNCIDVFWKDIPLVDKRKLTLDADELLMIFIYVTLRSKLSELFSHLKLINEFSTDTLRRSKLGYYTSTIEVAAQQVMNLDPTMLVDKNFKDTFKGNAESLIQSHIKSSMASDFPFQVPDDLEFLDEINKKAMAFDEMEIMLLQK